MSKPDTFPERIVLSRKGWDSKAGGGPSPLLPCFSHSNGGSSTCASLGMLPIPDKESCVTYKNLMFPDGTPMGDVVEGLTRGHQKRIKRHFEAHLDPDLWIGSMKGRRCFKAAFGQSGNAQGHLRNQAICSGDLFLFFGLYRRAEQISTGWRYIPGAPVLHVIFGWLQVGEARLVRDGFPSECVRHPHAIPSGIVRQELRRRRDDNNTLYLAKDRLTFDRRFTGAGLFNECFSAAQEDSRLLSNLAGYPENYQCSRWSLPAFFCGMSNMGRQQPPDGDRWYPQRRGPGQEFVLRTAGIETQAREWLKRLYRCAKHTTSGSQLNVRISAGID